MIRIWTVFISMMLAVFSAWAMAPDRLSAVADPPSLEDTVPEAFGIWQIDKSVQPVLPRQEEDSDSLAARIYDQTLVRTYRNLQGDRVMLVMAYGRDQSDTLQLHLPEFCYASQGFAVRQKVHRTLDLGGNGLPVVRLQTRRGKRREPVTYWTRVGDSVAPSMLSRQWAKLAYGVRGRVPDGVLVRVSTISSQTDRAFGIQEQFIRDLIAAVPPERRAFLLGARGPE